MHDFTGLMHVRIGVPRQQDDWLALRTRFFNQMAGLIRVELIPTFNVRHVPWADLAIERWRRCAYTVEDSPMDRIFVNGMCCSLT